MQYKKLNKNAEKCMYVATASGIVVVVIILFVLFFLLKGEIPVEYTILSNIILLALVLVLVSYLVISPKIRYMRYRYLINEDRIDFIEGLLFITRTIVPINRIHKIALQRGPIDNIFGLSKLIITTAGGDAIVRFLEIPVAEDIADKLKNKINDDIENVKQEVK
ncbi:MAG: PH domain-containing protein [Clostridia bacterium]|nr:PH domain-containing protein [Clostridia bacterium]